MLRLLRRNPLSITGNQAFLTHLPSSQNQINKPAEPTLLTVSYCSSAFSTFDRKPSDKPASALSLLSRYGFSDSQVSRIVQKQPLLTTDDSEKTIKSKLDYFVTFGYSSAELVNLVCSDPKILRTSLEDRIIRNLTLLETIVGSKENVKKAIKHTNGLLHGNLEKIVMPKVNTLKEYGVPSGKIVHALTRHPRAMTARGDSFTNTVEKLKELGMKPVTTLFITGMHVMLGQPRSNWERKLKLYQSFGWSEKDTLLAFTKYPFCMARSEDKIKKTMQFFVEKLQVNPSILAVKPVFIGYSLEKRIIPRCSVINVLVSKGLLDGIPAWTTLFMMPEKKFKEKFIDKYGKEVPQVLDAFQGKLEFTGFDLMGKEKKQSGTNKKLKR